MNLYLILKYGCPVISTVPYSDLYSKLDTKLCVLFLPSCLEILYCFISQSNSIICELLRQENKRWCAGAVEILAIVLWNLHDCGYSETRQMETWKCVKMILSSPRKRPKISKMNPETRFFNLLVEFWMIFPKLWIVVYQISREVSNYYFVGNSMFFTIGFALQRIFLNSFSFPFQKLISWSQNSLKMGLAKGQQM